MKSLDWLLIIGLFAQIVTEVSCQEKKEEEELAPPFIHFGLEKPYKDPIESRKIAEERKYEKNRIKYMEGLEKKDKENFREIIQNQEKIQDRLGSLSEKIKTYAVEDRSRIFAKAYPPNSNLDSWWRSQENQPNFKELEQSIDLVSKEGILKGYGEPPKGFLESSNDE